MNKPGYNAEPRPSGAENLDMSTLKRGRAILGFLLEAEGAVNEISEKLFGPEPTGDNNPPAPISGLDQALANGSTRAACLVGALRTIAARLGE